MLQDLEATWKNLEVVTVVSSQTTGLSIHEHKSVSGKLAHLNVWFIHRCPKKNPAADSTITKTVPALKYYVLNEVVCGQAAQYKSFVYVLTYFTVFLSALFLFIVFCVSDAIYNPEPKRVWMLCKR